MTIKHLILTGGGPVGFVEYGALKYLTEKKYIVYENIESIYATSIGSFIGLIYLLNLDWLWVDDYLIKKPWENVVSFSYTNYFSYTNLVYEKGLINRTNVCNALEPLFLTKNIPLTITMLEFYNLIKIEFNIYACSFTTLEQKKFNYINTPNVMLVDALYVSLAFPFIFAPLYIDDCFYLDGGIIQGCPVNNCITEKQCDYSEILCFINDKTKPIDLSNPYHNNNNNNDNNNNISFLKYFIVILNAWFMKILNIENEIIVHIKNSINVALAHEGSNLKYWRHVLITESEREYLINLGSTQAKKFIKTMDYNPNCTSNNNDIINNDDVNNDDVNNHDVNNDDVNSNLLDEKILYLLHIYFKYISYFFYIYCILIAYLLHKNIKILQYYNIKMNKNIKIIIFILNILNDYN